MTTTITKKPATKKPAKSFTLEVYVNDLKYKAKAKNLETALRDFVASPAFPFSIKTRVFLKFGKGKDLSTRTYSVNIGRRLFRNIQFKESALEILSDRLQQE